MEHPKNTPSRLTDNITSELFAAASQMHRTGIVMVYVEGYEDIAFWKNILNYYETDKRKFEISTPTRSDMAKGKKVVLNFADKTGDNLLLCVDSDFDFLFGDAFDQSRLVNSNKYVMQTYSYSIENLQCYPPSLHTIAVKATKNDSRIFDFEIFMSQYSVTIYPLFLWYVMAAKNNNPGIFPLTDFRNAVRINFLDLENDGEDTIKWLARQVKRKLTNLKEKNPTMENDITTLEQELIQCGVTPETTHMYMQGHTLMDYVVKIVLDSVCDTLRKEWVEQIMSSSRKGLTLHNELSYYNNSLRDIDSLLLDNTLYQDSEQFKMIMADLSTVLK